MSCKPVRCKGGGDVAGCFLASPQSFANIKEMAMGKVIDFCVPAIFHKPLKGASEPQRAKVIEFCPQTRKSA
jgi:hypothetical protein